MAAILAFALPSQGASLALLIGIDDYQHGRKLCGCVNDVQLMGRLLVDRLGFPETSVTTLINDQATRRASTDALRQHLVRPTQPGEVVVFYFSGHAVKRPIGPTSMRSMTSTRSSAP